MSGKRRRRWTAQEKLRIVLAHASGRHRDLGALPNPTQYYGWRKQLLGSAGKVFSSDQARPSAKEQRLESELRRAKDVIAEITAENLEPKKGLSV